jgi:hypothetical protein
MGAFEARPIAGPDHLVRSDLAVRAAKKNRFEDDRRGVFSTFGRRQAKHVRQRSVDDSRFRLRERPGMAGGAGQLFQVNRRQALMDQARRTQPSLGVATAAGEGFDQARFGLELLPGQFPRVILADGLVVAAD